MTDPRVLKVTQGFNGWTPKLSVVSDGARRVLKLSGWTGGQGNPPQYNLFLGLTGYVTDIADAVNIAGDATLVQYQEDGVNVGAPDVDTINFTGDVDVSYLSGTLTINIVGGGDVQSVNGVLPDMSGNISLNTGDIPESIDANYVTDADLVVIGNTSNTNTGDETQATIKTKLGQAASGTDGYLSGTDWTTFDGKQAALADVITANTYGSSTQYPIVTVNAKGIVTGVTLQTVDSIAPPAYTASVPYVAGQLVTHQDHVWKILSNHTGAIPFVNGNLELQGATFDAGTVISPYTAQRLAATNVASKELRLFGTGTTFVLDLAQAPLRTRFITTNGFNVTEVTLNAAGATFYTDESSTAVGTGSYVLRIAGGQELVLIRFPSEVIVKVISSNIVNHFKLIDGATLGAANLGWNFAGAVTGNRTLSLPNADVDLGKLTNSTVAPSNITVTASPFTYQNTTAFNGDVIISGGTVSNIEFTRDNTTFYTTGLLMGVLRLSPSDRVRVTYTVAPTMTYVPR